MRAVLTPTGDHPPMSGGWQRQSLAGQLCAALHGRPLRCRAWPAGPVVGRLLAFSGHGAAPGDQTYQPDELPSSRNCRAAELAGRFLARSGRMAWYPASASLASTGCRNERKMKMKRCLIGLHRAGAWPEPAMPTPKSWLHEGDLAERGELVCRLCTATTPKGDRQRDDRTWPMHRLSSLMAEFCHRPGAGLGEAGIHLPFMRAGIDR